MKKKFWNKRNIAIAKEVLEGGSQKDVAEKYAVSPNRIYKISLSILRLASTRAGLDIRNTSEAREQKDKLLPILDHTLEDQNDARN